jgi:gamma-glutamylcyclotransferase
VLLFAYGANMSSAEMTAFCPQARFVGPARLDGHRFELRRRSRRWGGGAADIVPADGEAVWGALYEVPPGVLSDLDAKEGAGFAYRRREVQVQHDGRAVAAMVYEVMDKEPEQVPAAPGYVELLEAGARERGLPSDYVDLLSTRVRRP